VTLLGPPGFGKTRIAVAMGVTVCPAGFSIYFTIVDDLVRQLREAEALGRFSKKPQAYLEPAVLVLDEVGYLPLSRAEGNGPPSPATKSRPPPSLTASCTAATCAPSRAQLPAQDRDLGRSAATTRDA
jgi:hypothetical protein